MKRKLAKGAKKQIINLIILLALVAITLVILFLSNRELDFVSIRDFLRDSNPIFLVVAFACMLGYILFEALSLHVISRAFGHKCKFRKSVVYSAADVYYSAITPSAAGGQPASAYYMVQDGMSAGTATFSLVFNLIAYTGAIIVLGAVAFAIRSAMFLQFRFLVKFLIILGIAVQFLLLTFFTACMFCHRAVLKCGNAFITFFKKIKIVKKEEKWRDKLTGAVEKYKGCLSALREHRALFVIVLLFNIMQRASQILITCFVCKSVSNETSFLMIFAMQAFVTLGYNSVPLPGGVGAFEYMYLNVYCVCFEDSFIIAAMMVTRTISYYISLLISGAITLAEHGRLVRRKKTETSEIEPSGEFAFAAEQDGVCENNADTDKLFEKEQVAEQSDLKVENDEELREKEL